MNSLSKKIDKACEVFSTRIALLTHDQTISYGELSKKVNALVKELKPYRFSSVGLYMTNCVDWVVFDLAAIQLGITVIPIPLFFSQSQVEHVIKDARITAVVSDANYDSSSHVDETSFFNEYTATFIQALGSAVLLQCADNQQWVSNEKTYIPDGCCKITYTSGSTGQPKGVCLSANNLLAVSQALTEVLDSALMAKHLCVLPFSTLLENVAGIYVPLLLGGTLIVDSPDQLGLLSNSGFDCKRFSQAVVTWAATSAILLPQMLKNIVLNGADSNLNSLQFMAVGGGKVSRNLLALAVKQGLPIYQGYGLSECGSVVSLNVPSANCNGSVGRPLSHVALSISEGGEVLVDGELMLGYLGELDRVDSHKIKTGDLGYVDQQGFVHLNGRKKDVIISSFGRNISPEWVESEVVAMPEVAQVVVLGDGEAYLSAIVVPAQSTVDAHVIKTVFESCNQGLPDYAHIKKIICFGSGFTKENGFLTTNGKICRSKIIDAYNKGFFKENDLLIENINTENIT